MHAPTEPCLPYSSAADDASSLQKFIRTAEADQKTLHSACLSAGLNFTVSATVQVSAPAVLDFNGATVSKAGDMNDVVMNITGPDVTIYNLNVNGNRTSGAKGGGLFWSAPGGRLDDVEVSNTQSSGIEVKGEGNSLEMEDSSSDYNINSSTAHGGDGIVAQNGALLITSRTSATNNGYDGYLLHDAARGSRLSGRSANNYHAGIDVNGTPSLAIPSFTSVQDWHYGVYLRGASDGCTIGKLNILNTGMPQRGLPNNKFGAGIEFFGTSNCEVTSIIDRNTYRLTSGYGLALARQVSVTGTNSQGSDDNTFEYVSVAGTGNPGIDLTGSSSNNTFVNVTTTDCDVGVNIGEGTLNNDDNTFDNVVLSHDWFDGVGVEGGSGNVFGIVSATDVDSSYPDERGNGIVRLVNAVSDTIIRRINVYVDETLKHEPQYVVYADSHTTGNSIVFGTIRPGSYSVAEWADDSGGNNFR